MRIYVCEYQIERYGSWYKGIRIEDNDDNIDKIVDLKGNIVKDVYYVVNSPEEGCFNITT